MVPLVFSVDDDATGQIILRAFLKDEAFCDEFVCYQSPTAALKDLSFRAENDFDSFPEVLFIDIRMPEMDGWELVENIIPLVQDKERLPAIVMLTGTATKEDHERALANPFVLALEEKPLNMDLLYELRGFRHISQYFNSRAQATCA